MSHWASKYIGVPWSPYGTGPDSYNCWGLVSHVLRTHFGVPIDYDAVSRNSLRSLAIRVLRADKSGDVLVLTCNGLKHAGILIGVGNKVMALHASGCTLPKGNVGQVICEPVMDLIVKFDRCDIWRPK
jgi:cell wall-associated NlpC family hydrolase